MVSGNRGRRQLAAVQAWSECSTQSPRRTEQDRGRQGPAHLSQADRLGQYRNRIKGIFNSIQAGLADDDEAEALTIERVQKESPEELKPLPYAQGLAVSLNYERGAQEAKFGKTARGETAG